MSSQLRGQDIWPANRHAQRIWHTGAVLEDVQAFADLQRILSEPRTRLLVSKHALLALHSFDEEVKRWQRDLRQDNEYDLSLDERASIDRMFAEYHRALEPRRSLLTKIRHNLAAHSGSLPGPSERKRYGQAFEAWGDWEAALAELEGEARLEDWADVINSAMALWNQLKDLRLAEWFRIEAGQLRQFFPLRV